MPDVGTLPPSAFLTVDDVHHVFNEIVNAFSILTLSSENDASASVAAARVVLANTPTSVPDDRLAVTKAVPDPIDEFFAAGVERRTLDDFLVVLDDNLPVWTPPKGDSEGRADRQDVSPSVLGGSALPVQEQETQAKEVSIVETKATPEVAPESLSLEEPIDWAALLEEDFETVWTAAEAEAAPAPLVPYNYVPSISFASIPTTEPLRIKLQDPSGVQLKGKGGSEDAKEAAKTKEDTPGSNPTPRRIDSQPSAESPAQVVFVAGDDDARPKSPKELVSKLLAGPNATSTDTAASSSSLSSQQGLAPDTTGAASNPSESALKLKKQVERRRRKPPSLFIKRR
ncbi:hypothetical protein RJ55_07166 [Drechmeria coniospora]|nr:hypothetical protein RJ55_07166 [Drechmeria coniospora]